MEMNLETVMLLVGSAVEKCYADNNLNLDFSIFEDVHYDLCIQWKLEQVEDCGDLVSSRQAEADAAFYSRFGHLGSI